MFTVVIKMCFKQNNLCEVLSDKLSREHNTHCLLGEQGAESIHAKFNDLAKANSAIQGKVHKLKCIVAEHLVSNAPHIVAAIPPPKKRKK